MRKSPSKLKSIPMGVSPLQLVNLHRNRSYFVIKLHTWFCLSYFLKTNIKFYSIYQYFMSISSFSTPYLFLDTAARLQWPVTQISTSQQFFLLTRLFNNMKYWHPHLPFGQHISVSTLVIIIIISKIYSCYHSYCVLQILDRLS